MDEVGAAPDDGRPYPAPGRDGALERYLDSLEASWRALAAVDGDALVERAPGYLLSRRPRHPVFSNAVLLDLRDRDVVLGAFAGERVWAVWSGSEEVDAACAAAGLHRDVMTWPMLADLDATPPARADAGHDVVRVHAAQVAELDGLDPTVLGGVAGLQAWATVDGRAGLVLQRVEDDVHVSFVATHPSARRRGLATAVLSAALVDAHRTGARTASLGSTLDGRRLYERLGFRVLGRWQEWVPPAGP